MTDSRTTKRVKWYRVRVVGAEVRLSALSKMPYVLVKFGYDDSGEERHFFASLSLLEFPTPWSTTRLHRFEEVLGDIDIPWVSFTPDSLTSLFRRTWVDKEVEIKVGFVDIDDIMHKRVVDIRKLGSGKE